MAQSSTRPGIEKGGPKPGFERKGRMAHGIDVGMNAVEAAGPLPPRDCPATQARVGQLRSAYHAVLSLNHLA